MEENTYKFKIGSQRNTKEYELAMAHIMREVMKKTKEPPTSPKTRNECVKQFLKLPDTNLGYASECYRNCSKQLSNFVEFGVLGMEAVESLRESVQELDAIKAKILQEYESEEKNAMTKGYASALVSNIKTKADINKTLIDFAHKNSMTEVQFDRNDILNKRLENDMTAGFAVNFQLEGSLEQKTMKAIKIAAKHEDILDAAFMEVTQEAMMIEADE